ncbi:MAG: hypothetical protein Q8R88_09545 [Desulfoprunum sp.]|nr:hypothetical protein [Desulfoprunum sp.]
MLLKKCVRVLAVAGLIVVGSGLCVSAAEEDMQKQIDGIIAALPKFAVPMREVGDRFQNMYFAAEGGNWALASYMAKYMDKAMNPAKITKPREHPNWANFYKDQFAPVNNAIAAGDMTAFTKEYTAVISSCNECHAIMGYGFIKVVKLASPADPGIDYKMTSKAGDVPQ